MGHYFLLFQKEAPTVTFLNFKINLLHVTMLNVILDAEVTCYYGTDLILEEVKKMSKFIS